MSPVQSIHETYNYFELKSKPGIFFPKELTTMRDKYKMVEILYRGHFRIFLHKWQKISEVPASLGLTSPSEVVSACLCAPPSSPWAEIGIGNKKVVINAPYR